MCKNKKCDNSDKLYMFKALDSANSNMLLHLQNFQTPNVYSNVPNQASVQKSTQNLFAETVQIVL